MQFSGLPDDRSTYQSIAWLTLLIALAALALAVPYWIGFRNIPPVNDPKLSLSGSPRPLTSLPGIETDPAISPEGRNLAFLRGYAGGGQEICRLPIENREADAEAQALWRSEPRLIQSVQWSPDGTELFYTEPGSTALWRIPAFGDTGGDPEGIATAPNARTLSMRHSIQGLVYVAFASDFDIWRVPGWMLWVLTKKSQSRAKWNHSLR